MYDFAMETCFRNICRLWTFETLQEGKLTAPGILRAVTLADSSLSGDLPALSAAAELPFAWSWRLMESTLKRVSREFQTPGCGLSAN